VKICRKNLHQFEGHRCLECHKISSKAWKKAHPERCAADTKAYHKVNPGKYIETKKAWDKANPDKINAISKAWKKANPDKHSAAQAKRRAAKLNATPKDLSREDWNKINEFYKEANRLTKETNIPHEVDHIIPLQPKEGDPKGEHAPWNLRVITASENRKKGNNLSRDNNER
jgi:ABC-type nitrate/sulfonate/bicarbonate transport system substrate-binding protein